jgi:hypothetical protein
MKGKGGLKLWNIKKEECESGKLEDEELQGP